MKKSSIILFASILTIMLLTSCSRRIIGATPHRRDRHCGCENIRTPQSDNQNIAQTTYYNID
ncbi:MAG: hypothetical protein MJZ87_01600 [Bacteroidales bacterium]|nr:hypothetical protein [Bacteroidales bacterium]